MTTDPGVVVFLDFDGTITSRDAVDAILEAFADPSWVQFEEAWLAGRIGSRECLAEQMALVHATCDQVNVLLDTIQIDPGFATLLDLCASRGLPVHVLSDGFDYCIARMLGRAEVADLAGRVVSTILASSLRCDGGRWHVAFTHPSAPCAHGCATCKPLAMAQLNPDGAVTVFVGDGRSDRHAVACADLVFAKKSLATFCEGASIPYTPYDSLATVADGVRRLLDAGVPWAPSRHRKVSPTV